MALRPTVDARACPPPIRVPELSPGRAAAVREDSAGVFPETRVVPPTGFVTALPRGARAAVTG
jgi:hypothetical protein